MSAKYFPVHAGNLHSAWVIRKEGATAASSGLYAAPDLGSCGLGWLQSFVYAAKFVDWKDEAGWMAALYRHLFTPGNVLYCLTDSQITRGNAGHQALLNIGAVQIAEFPNLTHGPNKLQVFTVNIRNACGRYCNKYGEAYTEPPKDDSEVMENPNVVGQLMPQRPRSY